MKPREEIKSLFNDLPLVVQRDLSGELPLGQELHGKVPQEAQEGVLGKRKKKPCPHCQVLKFVSGASKEEFKCIDAMTAINGIAKRQVHLCMI